MSATRTVTSSKSGSRRDSRADRVSGGSSRSQSTFQEVDPELRQCELDRRRSTAEPTAGSEFRARPTEDAQESPIRHDRDAFHRWQGDVARAGWPIDPGQGDIADHGTTPVRPEISDLESAAGGQGVQLTAERSMNLQCRRPAIHWPTIALTLDRTHDSLPRAIPWRTDPRCSPTALLDSCGTGRRRRPPRRTEWIQR
jgi:hypothetical protein